MKTVNFAKQITFFLLSLFFLLSACKKDKPAPTYTVYGNWQGTYTTNENPPSSYFLGLNIKDDGFLEIMTNQVDKSLITGKGGWSIENGKFSAQFFLNINPGGSSFLYTADFDEKTGKIENGTWGYNPDNTDGGTWTVIKQ